MNKVVAVYPMLQSIGRVLHSDFKRDFSALAMDSEDVIQESYLFYLDFKKRFEKKFKKEILWSAIKQYVTWKILQTVYNHRKKNVQLLSLDSKVKENSFYEYDNEINEAIIERSPKKLLPFKNDKDLIEIILKNDPILFKTLKEMLGARKYKIFMKVLENKETCEAIGKKMNVSKQYISSIYHKSLSQIRTKLLK